jgi:maleate isomerase
MRADEGSATKRAKLIRVGLVVPSSNTVMENDLHRGLPATYTVHTGRMYLVETTREAEIKMIEEYAPKAAADVGTANPDLLVFGCTSAGSLFGLEYDAKVCRQLGEQAGCAGMGVVSSVADALGRYAFRRLAVITPYNEDLTKAVAAAVSAPDRQVVAARGMGITVNVALADPTPEDIVAFAKTKLAGIKFDGIFVSCTNFRALEAKAQLERAFDVPVVTSNSAVIDAIRRRFEAT